MKAQKRLGILTNGGEWRTSAHLALQAGIAGRANVILIPELSSMARSPTLQICNIFIISD
jgi:6-phosphofructokinase